MPQKFIAILGVLSTIDWRAIMVFVSAAAFMPSNGMPIWLEVIMRFCLPILGGVLWIFLKPRVIMWRKKMHNRKKRK